jgi:nucleotide-binding universal stress UspA family protein
MAEVFNKILLATQRTEFDEGAERLGFALSTHCQKPLRAIIPVLSNPVFETVAPELAERLDVETGEHLNALRQAAVKHGVSLDATVRHGEEPYAEIVEEAESSGADLIVIRRRGKRGFFAKALVGEMVSKVIGHAPCSVLIVPRQAQMWSKKLLIASDGSPDSERATHIAAAIATQCKVPVAVISAYAESSSAERKQLAQQHADHAVATLRAAGVAAESVVRGGKPYEAILSAAKEQGADLIVIGRSGRSAVERVLMGSTAERVAGFAECPVLVTR